MSNNYLRVSRERSRPARRSLTSGLLALGLLAAGGLTAPASADRLEDALARLHDADVLVADAAVEELVALGTPAVDALLPLLASPQRDVKAGALRGLGLLGDARAAEPIRRQLADSLALERPDTMNDRYFRNLAIQALGRLRDAESAALLRDLSRREDSFERAHAAIALFLCGEDPGYDLVREGLNDGEMAIRNLVVNGVGESDDPRALDLLLPRVDDSSWVVRDTAFRALARHAADSRVQDALKRGESDSSWFVRETVAEIRSTQ